LEDTLKDFMQLTSQAISELKNVATENTQAIARIEGQLEYLVAEVTKIEEEELPSLLMAGHYLIDEKIPAILVMSMFLPSPYLKVRKLWIAMRRKKKRSTWSKQHPRQIQILPMPKK
jgi:uncharacterized coiled-coil protein SlyX